MSSQEFDAFFRENYNLIVRFTQRRIDPDLALDVAAECFAIAWRKYDPADPFAIAWLYQTARNLLGNAYRKRAREQRLLEKMEDQARALSLTSEEFDLSAALDSLSAKEREVLQLTFWEELSAADVGKVVGCSEAAAWKRISRAKQNLRNFLSTTIAPKEEADA